MSSVNPPGAGQPAPSNQPSAAPGSTPPPTGDGDTSYLNWPFAKMFTQAGAPPPTRDEILKMIQQTIQNQLSPEIQRQADKYKESMQKWKEALEDQ